MEEKMMNGYMKTQVENCFRIRAYGRTELAVAYCPELTPGSAYRKLRQWIARSPGLSDRLRRLGDGRARTWTPAEVREIVGALGEP